MPDIQTDDLGGRPTKYLPAFCKQVHKLCLLGATDKEIADFLEIAESTFYEWKVKYPKFSEAVKGGKIIADANVAASFYKRAIGYEYNELTFERIDSKVALENMVTGDVIEEPYKKKVVTKHLPADAGAALNWLKNRQPDKWKDAKNIEIDYSKLTDEQLTIIADNIINKANGQDSNT